MAKVQTQRQKIGQQGEEAAARFLLAEGFELLHRNWRSGRYELDLVARRGDVLHMIEVKCRKAGSLTSPEEALTPSKCNALLKAAQCYIACFGLNLDTQFDLIAVEYHTQGAYAIRYIPNAIVPRW